MLAIGIRGFVFLFIFSSNVEEEFILFKLVLYLVKYEVSKYLRFEFKLSFGLFFSSFSFKFDKFLISNLFVTFFLLLLINSKLSLLKL